MRRNSPQPITLVCQKFQTVTDGFSKSTPTSGLTYQVGQLQKTSMISIISARSPVLASCQSVQDRIQSNVNRIYSMLENIRDRLVDTLALVLGLSAFTRLLQGCLLLERLRLLVLSLVDVARLRLRCAPLSWCHASTSRAYRRSLPRVRTPAIKYNPRPCSASSMCRNLRDLNSRTSIRRPS